jgi:hypothetical protein
MEEYICRTAISGEWQKWLNQWKHIYEIEIISMSATDNTTTILIKRKKKEE